MWTYILKRVLLIPPTLLGITVLAYTMISFAPGDPLSLAAGDAERGFTKEAMRGAQMGETYEKNIVSIMGRYVTWLTTLFNVSWDKPQLPPEDAWVLAGPSVVKGEAPRPGPIAVYVHEALAFRAGKLHVNLFNFQRSLKDRRPVLQNLLRAIAISLPLNIIALCITYMIAIPLGVYSAVHRDTVKERITTVTLFILYSLPPFWVAYMLILFVGQGSGKLELLPFVGLWGEEAGNYMETEQYLKVAKDVLLHLILPITCMTLGSFAYLSRQARAGMLEVLRQDYITTARAKGLPENLVIFKHALRNSLIPIVTLMASLLPALLGGSIIIESIFTINGMGRLGFNAVLSRDYTTLMAVDLVAAIMVLIGILISDMLYTVVDPRVSFEKQVG